MTLRSRLAVAGVSAMVLASVAACGSGTSTESPVTASSAAQSSAVESAVAPSQPSESAPSEAASNSASGGVAPDAATLLTAEMAGSVIGGGPQKVSAPFSIPNMSIVSYSNAEGDTVDVFIEVVPGGVANVEMQAAIAMAGAQGDLQPVTGVGDAAGKVVGDGDATVAFVKGTNLVVVEATSGTMSGSDLEPKVEDIARQIASKL